MTSPSQLYSPQPAGWNREDETIIVERLSGHREEIAEVLDIGLDETEARPVVGSLTEAERSSPIEHVKALRRPRSEWEEVALIDLVLAELRDILCRFVMEYTCFPDRPSYPKLVKTLKRIGDSPSLDEDLLEKVPEQVRRLLKHHYPGGPEKFTRGTIDPDDVRVAATSALADVQKPRRGRPRGSNNYRARKFFDELREIFDRNAKHRAGRSVIVNKSRDLSTPDTRESGLFLRFCELAVGALPDWAQTKTVKKGGSLANMARHSIKRANKLRRDPYRRIDPQSN